MVPPSGRQSTFPTACRALAPSPNPRTRCPAPCMGMHPSTFSFRPNARPDLGPAKRHPALHEPPSYDTTRTCPRRAPPSPTSATGTDDASTSTSQKSIAVFVSGGGSNFKAIHADILEGDINGYVSVVVTNAPSCAAADYARRHGIPIAVYPPGKHATDNENTVCASPRDLVVALQSHDVDLVVLAGYMKLIPVEVVRAYERKMLNIHPGLLPGPFGGPGMYGMNVHTAVVNSGSRVSGCTVHFVNEVFDDGPILGQAVVPVTIHDSPERVAARVLKQEHELFPRCVRAFCDERIGWRQDGVPFLVEDL